MEFDDAFSVGAPIDEVWAALLDVERVAPCMPGAQVLEQLGDDRYAVAVRVRVGPIAMRYRGEVEIVERDPEQHRAVMRAKAREARGQGTATAVIETRLSGDGDATSGAIHTDLQMSGRAAAMGRGVIQDVGARLVATFADNLARTLSAEPEAAEPTPEPVAAPPVAEPEGEEAAPPSDESLPLGDIAKSVIAGRLRDPRVLGGLALLCLLLGYALGRARR